MVGIGAAYYLLRRFLPLPLAAFGGLSLLLVPGFLVNTTSFMTDVPALSGEMLCLALGAAAVDRKGASRWLWLVAALAAGCFAFSIREFALAAPVAVLIFAGAGGAGKRLGYVLAGLVTLAACAAIYVVTANLPGRQGSSSPAFAPTNFDQVRYAAVSLGLTLSSALVLALAAAWRDWRAIDFAAGTLAGIVLYRDELQTVATTMTIPRLLLGNLLAPHGAPAGAAGSRPVLLGSPIWDILNFIGLVSVIVSLGVLSAVIGRWWRSGGLAGRRRLGKWLSSTEGLLATFALLYGGGLIAFGLLVVMFDRYVWALSIPLIGLLLRPRTTTGAASAHSRAARIGTYGAAGVLTATLAWTSSALLLNAFAFDAASWRMGELAVEKGFAPQTVDAGMAWVGYHATGVAQLGALPTSSETWYDALWPSFKLCAMVSASPLNAPGFELVAADVDAYRLVLVDGMQAPLYLYRIATPGCP